MFFIMAVVNNSLKPSGICFILVILQTPVSREINDILTVNEVCLVRKWETKSMDKDETKMDPISTEDETRKNTNEVLPTHSFSSS